MSSSASSEIGPDTVSVASPWASNRTVVCLASVIRVDESQKSGAAARITCHTLTRMPSGLGQNYPNLPDGATAHTVLSGAPRVGAATYGNPGVLDVMIKDFTERLATI